MIILSCVSKIGSVGSLVCLFYFLVFGVLGSVFEDIMFNKVVENVLFGV